MKNKNSLALLYTAAGCTFVVLSTTINVSWIKYTLLAIAVLLCALSLIMLILPKDKR